MSIPKKGSRKITVDGTTYRWTIRRKPSYGQAIDESNLTAAVELYESPGTTLIVTFPFTRPDSWLTPGNKSVTPSDIKHSIIEALRKGWEPEVNGGAFQMVQEK